MLLRILPVMVGDIVDHTDKVWKLLLLLRQLVEYICAPKISVEQVCYLNVLIQEYLELRSELFPDQRLKPKHHYLLHYPRLMIEFDPLIRLWTLRFKNHSYFKQATRSMENFKDPCFMLKNTSYFKHT